MWARRAGYSSDCRTDFMRGVNLPLLHLLLGCAFGRVTSQSGDIIHIIYVDDVPCLIVPQTGALLNSAPVCGTAASTGPLGGSPHHQSNVELRGARVLESR